MNNFGELLEKLAAKQFDALIGVSDGVWLDAEEGSYILDTLKKKLDVKLTASGEVHALCSVRPWTSGAHCRVPLTTSLEAFTVGNTIVVSRGLIDVLPSESAVALVLAHQLAHNVLPKGGQ